MPKSSAPDRTLDMFAPTAVTLAEEDTPQQAVAIGHINEPIEVAADRWRASAMFTAEHLSKHFNDGEPGKAVFRLTEKDGMLFLEQFRHGKDGQAFHWSGVMFKPGDLEEIAGVLVKAVRDRRANGRPV